MCALHTDFAELYFDKFYCNQVIFNFIKFDSYWANRADIVYLLVQNASFTILNNESKYMFAYIINWNSDA